MKFGKFPANALILVSLLLSPVLAIGQTAPQAAAPSTQPTRTDYKFQFGSSPLQSGFIAVASTDKYADTPGYGFESDGKVQAFDHGITGEGPFYFSVALPEGSYRVTVTLGDPAGESMTTVKAELRRLMLERVHTDPGQIVTRTFNVNIRQPQISTGGKVRLKSRETSNEARAWDNKLTLEFLDSHPCIDSIEISKAGDIPTFYICGDSTSTDQPAEPFSSWGQSLTRFFGSDIVLANHGESGEDAGAFIGEQRWKKVLSTIKPGDWVIIQFAHNDEKNKGPNAGAYMNFTDNMTKLVKEARDHGAFPIVVTPMHRKSFDAQGKVQNSHGDYPDAVRKIAKDQNVPLIDLTNMSQQVMEAIGPTDAHLLFAGNDSTHQSDYGSYEYTKCIVEGIKQDNLPLAKYLLPNLPTFDPAHPDAFKDFTLPAEPSSRRTATPLGS